MESPDTTKKRLVPKAQTGKKLSSFGLDNIPWWKSWNQGVAGSSTPSYLQTPQEQAAFRMKGIMPTTPSIRTNPITAARVTASPIRVQGPKAIAQAKFSLQSPDMASRDISSQGLIKQKPNPGEFSTEESSGNNALVENSGTYALLGPRQMSNLRPLPDALNYLLARRSLNKQRDIELGRKNLYYNAPSLSVRPVQDLPPALLAKQEQDRAQIRSEYGGSDPVMNMLGKNIATAQRTQLGTEQLAGREQAIRADQSRFDEQIRQNQLSSAETANKNLEREQDFSDYKIGVRGAHERAMADLNKTALQDIGKNWDTASQYNMEQEANQRKDIRQEYEDMLAMGNTADNWGEKQKEYTKAKSWYENARKNPAEYAAQPYSTYKQGQMAAFKNGWLNKFLTRSGAN